jgi:3'(2'), 5'-bisphosphate nucleotidase
VAWDPADPPCPSDAGDRAGDARGSTTRADDIEVAVAAAQAAARTLRRIRSQPSGRLSGAELGRAADRTANDAIHQTLRRLVPEDVILSEESPDDPARRDASRVWIVDPLDGTAEFCEPPREDWAVHVALVREGEPVVGVVLLPATGTMLTSRVTRPVERPERGDRSRILVSRTRPAWEAADLARRVNADLVPMGSAGAKTAAVVRGDADAYVHSGGQWEWDSAAPVAVARAAGLHVSRLDGSDLRYNQSRPWLPDLVVCRPGLRDVLLEAIGDIHRRAGSGVAG